MAELVNLLSSYIHKSTEGVIEAVLSTDTMYVINQYLILVRRLKSAFQERSASQENIYK